MTRYQLAKLIAMAGTFRSRKRLQKAVHLLQAAGAPWDVAFRLHHYGPYSHDLAGLLDELVQLQLLEERCASTASGNEYSYKLTEKGRRALEQVESADANLAAEFDARRQAIEKLMRANLRQLELASTMAYFEKDVAKPWDEAVRLTREFKSEAEGSHDMTAAERLAREFVG